MYHYNYVHIIFAYSPLFAEYQILSKFPKLFLHNSHKSIMSIYNMFKCSYVCADKCITAEFLAVKTQEAM